jgi:hypothetical protein
MAAGDRTPTAQPQGLLILPLFPCRSFVHSLSLLFQEHYFTCARLHMRVKFYSDP